MIKLGYEQVRVIFPIPKNAFKTQAFLFVVPMFITTGISILIFSTIKGISVQQQNIFSFIIIGSIILSLLGMAPIQIVMYRLVDEPAFTDGGIVRGLRSGIIYSFIYSAGIAAIGLIIFFLTGIFLPSN
ncbi:MAG: hypothetical protein NUV31_04190, partial [Dehalococcoidales bacterium]|nr:hypothetical protein [Dehalococcoidales bacterium]